MPNKEYLDGDYLRVPEIQQIIAYLWNEHGNVTRSELRKWVEAWLDTYCPKQTAGLPEKRTSAWLDRDAVRAALQWGSADDGDKVRLYTTELVVPCTRRPLVYPHDGTGASIEAALLKAHRESEKP